MLPHFKNITWYLSYRNTYDSLRVTNINSRSKFSAAQVFRNVLPTNVEAETCITEIAKYLKNSSAMFSVPNLSTTRNLDPYDYSMW